MTSRAEFSAQTLSVLATLIAEPSQWRHGYEMAQETGLKSGTLYPILIRLSDRGLLEACWQDEPAPGRPRRHLYRLTPDGLAAAEAALSARSRSAIVMCLTFPVLGLLCGALGAGLLGDRPARDGEGLAHRVP